MRLPRVSSFFWIGLILIAIGAYALHKGSAFMFDPGVPAEQHEAVFYLITGVLMVINGVIHPQPLPEDAKEAPAKGAATRVDVQQSAAPVREQSKLPSNP